VCGVLGIIGEVDILTAQSILDLLVHRGQDASGLAWVDPYKVHRMSKVKGSPNAIEIYSEISSVVIGSTRYPTLGNRMGDMHKDKFAQPYAYQTSLGTLSLVHNGNLTNMYDLSSKSYASDAEFITERLGELVNQKNDLKSALRLLTEEIDGAYSIVGILGENLFCYRDPRGIRPLVAGKTETHTVFSSESICLQQFGITEIFDVNPGELIFVSPDFKISRTQVVEKANVSHCYFEYVYFASSVSTIEKRNVYSTRLNLGRELAQELKGKGITSEIDYIVPVPDTSKSAATTISEELDIPLREAIMKNRSSKRTFIMPGADIREVAAKAKYLFVDEFIQGKSLLIVDDSIVRGLTTKYLVKILKDRGAKEVHVAITCPPQRFACYYGVDFGTDSQLIAKDNATNESIQFEIGSDSLTYLSITGLKKALTIDTLCMACLNGEYPTPNGRLIRLRLADGSIAEDTPHYEISQTK
jgi:amidophosphoribosyltransferase